jgi:nitrilase
MLIDPWGQVLAQKAQQAGVVLADLDFDVLTACRSRLPALQHRVG